MGCGASKNVVVPSQNVLENVDRQPRNVGEDKSEVKSGDLWLDTSFTRETALKDVHFDWEGDVLWQRPKEFLGKPTLFGKQTNRFDVEQGGVADCWLLSVVAAIADKPEALKEVIPRQKYDPESSSYDGMIHFRFWQFGKWVDVYIDDFIPTRKLGNDVIPVGATSPDRNVLWVTLLEKACAKFYGGYKAISGRSTINAMVLLSGGAGHQKHFKETTEDEAFNTIKSLLSTGNTCTVSVPVENDNICGLVGNHAYTVTSVAKIDYKKVNVKLARLRNPWGQSEMRVRPGVWTGAWSPGSKEWQNVDNKIVTKHSTGPGEFWIDVHDVFKYFEFYSSGLFKLYYDVTSMRTPLDVKCLLYGEWKDITGRVVDDEVSNNNPVFEVTVKDVRDVVFEIIQKERIGEDWQYVMLKVYKIAPFDKYGLVLYNDLTNTNTYISAQQVENRYRLLQGKYLLVVITRERFKGEFLLRVHCNKSLHCSQATVAGRVLTRQFDDVTDVDEMQKLLAQETYFLGAWQHSAKAGMTYSDATFVDNPQYLLDVTGRSGEVLLTLIRERETKKYGNGIRVVLNINDEEVPLTSEYCLNRFKDMPGKAILNHEVSLSVKLDPGRHLVLLYTNDPEDDRRYCLAISNPKEMKIKYTSYNVAD